MRSEQETELLYEISLAIGNSLKLRQMLRESLTTVMRVLNCNACAMFSADSVATEINWEVMISLPRTYARQTTPEALHKIGVQLPTMPNEYQHLVAQLPLLTTLHEGRHRFSLHLPDVGLLLLERNGQPLKTSLVASLQKLMVKLANAVQACRYEEQLQEKIRAAETANIAKSQFLANMSHEIRTPMNGVIGMLDLVMDEQLAEDTREHLAMARLSAIQLLEIINHLLDLSKIESGKFDLQPEKTDLIELVGTTAKSLAPRAWSKNLQIHYDIDVNIPRFVEVDATRLRQILINLLGNAVKFTESGHIKLLVAYYDQDSLPFFQFTVSDTGIGIAEDRIDFIFHAFEQVDGAANRRFEGTGLGLAITKQLIEIQGGSISVQSRPGEGSEFIFKLPLPLAKSAVNQERSAVDWSEKRVLVVDDEPINRRVIGTMLSTLGVHSETVTSAHEALVVLSQAKDTKQNIDLVLMDAWMPGMDGYMAIEKIIEQNLLPPNRFVILSSSALAGDAKRCQTIGIRGYLIKPLTINELKRVLESQLGVHRVMETGDNPVEDWSTLQVLLAEDNLINQRLAAELLRRRGIHPIIAANGEEALTCLKEHSFDLVLMDIMMPRMDGLEATRQIRAQEACEPHSKPLIIIALTANAMRGDEEKFLAAGMNGYVTKPVNAQKLYDEIRRLKPEHPGITGVETETASANDVIVADTISASTQEQLSQITETKNTHYDQQAALENMGGDKELFNHFLTMFTESLPEYSRQLEEIVAEDNKSEVERLAHTLKGLLGMFFAKKGVEAALNLEIAARDGEDIRKLASIMLAELRKWT